MNYLVTGATGFIGRKLVAALLARGDAVYYFARARSRAMPSQASFHPWNTNTRPELNALPRMHGIFHLAGEPVSQRWTDAVKKRIYDSRVEGTRNLVASLTNLRHRPAVLVSASAIGYYGDRGDEILTENKPPANDFLAAVCRDWEGAALRAREFGVRSAPLRFGTVFGRDGGALPKLLKPFRLGLGGRLGSGRQWMSWVHVEDLVRMLLSAADNEAIDSPLNCVSPKPVTNRDFTKTLAEVLHRPAPFVVPGFALRAAFGEMSSVLLTSQRVDSEAAQRAGFVFQYPDLRSALANLV